MAFTIAQRQNCLYATMILLTILVAALCYHTFEEKWILFRHAENEFEAQQFKKAIDLYQQSLALGGSDNPRLFAHLADSYVAVGNFSEAIKWYRDYLKFYPNDVNARLSFANALNWSGNLKEADEEYQKVLKQHEMDQNP